jgi:hypothetical protein
MIKITYVTELTTQSGSTSIRFHLPMHVAPRYQLGGHSNKKSSGLGSITSLSSEEIHYKLSVQINVMMPSDITSFVSINHPLQGKVDGNTVSLKLANPMPLDNDLVVEFFLADQHQPRAWIELHEEQEERTKKQRIDNAKEPQQAVMLNFMPDFKDQKIETEIIFLVDRYT